MDAEPKRRTDVPARPPLTALLAEISAGRMSPDEVARQMIDEETWRRWQRGEPEPVPGPCAVCGAQGESTEPGCDSGMVPASEEPGRYRRCPRAIAADERERLRRAQERSGVSERHRRCTLADYAPESAAAAEARDAAENYLAAFSERRSAGDGILLYGPPGTGKTHLAYAVLNALLAQREPAMAVLMTDFLRTVKATYTPDEHRKTEAEAYLREVTEAPILLIEDLGAARSSEWLEEQLLELVDYRYRRLLPTLATSNYAPDGALADRIGEAAESRITEMCEVYEVPGQDRRRERRGE